MFSSLTPLFSSPQPSNLLSPESSILSHPLSPIKLRLFNRINCNYEHIWIDPQGNMHLFVPIMRGDTIGIDNTCATWKEFDAFWEGARDPKKMSNQASLNRYVRDFGWDVDLFNLLGSVEQAPYQPIFSQKSQQLAQAKGYQALLMQLGPKLQPHVKKLMKESNCVCISLSPIKEDTHLGIDSKYALFSVTRADPTPPNTPRQPCSTRGLGFELRKMLQDEKKTHIMERKVEAVKDKIIAKAILQYEREHKKAIIKDNKDLEVLKSCIQKACVELIRLNSVPRPSLESGSSSSILSDEKKSLPTQSKEGLLDLTHTIYYENKLVEGKSERKRTSANMEFFTNAGIASPGDSARDFADYLWQSTIPEETLQVWEAGDSPFNSISKLDVTKVPAKVNLEATAEAYRRAECESFSIRCQMLLAMANVYCYERGYTTENFGRAIEENETLLRTLVDTIQQAINQNQDIEEAILNVLAANRHTLGIKQDLSSDDRLSIQQKFRVHYRIVKEGSHFDEFLLFLEGREGPFYQQRLRIVLHLGQWIQAALNDEKGSEMKEIEQTYQQYFAESSSPLTAVSSQTQKALLPARVPMVENRLIPNTDFHLSTGPQLEIDLAKLLAEEKEENHQIDILVWILTESIFSSQLSQENISAIINSPWWGEIRIRAVKKLNPEAFEKIFQENGQLLGHTIPPSSAPLFISNEVAEFIYLELSRNFKILGKKEKEKDIKAFESLKGPKKLIEAFRLASVGIRGDVFRIRICKDLMSHFGESMIKMFPLLSYQDYKGIGYLVNFSTPEERSAVCSLLDCFPYRYPRSFEEDTEPKVPLMKREEFIHRLAKPGIVRLASSNELELDQKEKIKEINIEEETKSIGSSTLAEPKVDEKQIATETQNDETALKVDKERTTPEIKLSEIKQGQGVEPPAASLSTGLSASQGEPSTNTVMTAELSVEKKEEKFELKTLEAQDHPSVTPQQIVSNRPTLLFTAWRTAMFLACSGILAKEWVTEVFSSGRLAPFLMLSDMVQWNLVFIFIHQTLAMTRLIQAYVRPSEDKDFHAHSKTSRTVGLNFSILVTGVFWILIYNPAVNGSPYLNLLTAGLPAILYFFDALIQPSPTAKPTAPSSTFCTFAKNYGPGTVLVLAYLIFNFAVEALEKNEPSNPLSALLDWRQNPPAAAIYSAVLVAVFITCTALTGWVLETLQKKALPSKLMGFIGFLKECSTPPPAQIPTPFNGRRADGPLS